MTGETFCAFTLARRDSRTGVARGAGASAAGAGMDATGMDATGMDATGMDATGDAVSPCDAGFATGAGATETLDTVASGAGVCIHDGDGMSGSFHSGISTDRAGSARCPITAAVHAAWRAAAERLRSKYDAAAAAPMSSEPLRAVSTRRFICPRPLPDSRVMQLDRAPLARAAEPSCREGLQPLFLPNRRRKS